MWIIQDDERDEQTALRADLAHATTECFLFVETSISDYKHELLKLSSPASQLFTSNRQAGRHGFQKLYHGSIRQRVVFGKREFAHE